MGYCRCLRAVNYIRALFGCCEPNWIVSLRQRAADWLQDRYAEVLELGASRAIIFHIQAPAESFLHQFQCFEQFSRTFHRRDM